METKRKVVQHTTFRLPTEELKALKIYAIEHGTTMQDFVVNAIRHCMEKKILPANRKK